MRVCHQSMGGIVLVGTNSLTVEDPRHEGVATIPLRQDPRTSASVKTTGTRAGRFARSTL